MRNITDFNGKIGLGWRVKGLPENVPLMWHQVHVNGKGEPRLLYGDWRMVVKGKTLSKRCTPRLCERGLHACSWLLGTALYVGKDSYNHVLTAVYLGGAIDGGGRASGSLCLDQQGGWVYAAFKLAAQQRTVLGMLDREQTSDLLGLAARKLALLRADECEAKAEWRRALETGEGLEEASRDMWREGSRIRWLDTTLGFSEAWHAVESAMRSNGNSALKGVLNVAGVHPSTSWLSIALEIEGEALKRMELDVESADPGDLLPF